MLGLIISDEITHERIIRHYSDNMLESAKDAVEDWYAHDYPNHPEILQQDIDAINQYNIDHDTNLDPYRILHAMKTSQPSRLTYTPGWAKANGVPQELIDLASHAVDGGTYNSEGIKAASYLDLHHFGKQGEVGPVGEFTNRTYSPITELPTETTETIVDQPARYEPTFEAEPEPVDIRAGYGAFGNYTPRDRIGELHKRIGSFLDRIRSKHHNEPVTEDIPPFISNDEREEEIPTFTLDEPQEQQLPPVILGERDEELRTTGENTPSPARREFMVPPIPPEKLFPKPLFKDIKKPSVEPSRVQEPVQPVQWHFEDMPVALPDPESRKYEPYSDFALTEAQAERWNNLHKQLATIRAEMKSRSTRADKFLKLRKQAKHLTDEINSFTAELGNPSAFEIEQALAEIERRKKLKDRIAEYERHMRNEPSGTDVPLWRVQKWEDERTKLLDKIAALGGADSLYESKLRFATPKRSRLEEKLAEIAQREADRQQPQMVFEMPMREEQPEERLPLEPERKERDVDILAKRFEFEHQKPDFENRHPRDKHLDLRNRLVSYPLMEIRGVPVKLLDLDGHTNPITNNNGHAMVVVDVNGLRVPFYFDGWDEYSKTGVWRPMLTVDRNGRLYTSSNNLNSKELKDIVDALNKHLNGKDFVDGIYATKQIDPNKIVDIVSKSVATDDNQMIWGSYGDNTAWHAQPDLVARFLREVESADYISPRGWEKFKNKMADLKNGPSKIKDRLWPFRGYGDRKYE